MIRCEAVGELRLSSDEVPWLKGECGESLRSGFVKELRIDVANGAAISIIIAFTGSILKE